MVCKSDSRLAKRFEYYISLWLAIRFSFFFFSFWRSKWMIFLAGIFFRVIWLFIALHAGIGLVCLLLKTVLHYIQRIPFYFFCCPSPSFTPCKITKTMKACLGTKKNHLISYWNLGFSGTKSRQFVSHRAFLLFLSNLSRLKGISFHWKVTNFLVKTLPFRFWKIDIDLCCQTEAALGEVWEEIPKSPPTIVLCWPTALHSFDSFDTSLC